MSVIVEAFWVLAFANKIRSSTNNMCDSGGAFLVIFIGVHCQTSTLCSIILERDSTQIINRQGVSGSPWRIPLVG